VLADAGPVLAIADLPAPTPVHPHGTWGVGLVLAGACRWERFGPDGGLVEARDLVAGDPVLVGAPPDDVHRQTPLDGPVRELLLFGAAPRSTPARPAATGTADRITAALLDGDRAALAALYAPDALIDVNVPQWRMQLTGPAGVAALLAEELGAPGRRCTVLRRVDTASGVLVETAVRLRGPDGERYWRDQHHIVLDGGEIAEHVVYCTGIWEPSTIARHAAEVALVRP
jgi:hypothetical protein